MYIISRDVQIEVVDDFIGLIDHVLNLGMPDLVIVNTELIGNIDASDWWRNWTNSDLDPAIPIIHKSANNTIEAEVTAFEMGSRRSQRCCRFMKKAAC